MKHKKLLLLSALTLALLLLLVACGDPQDTIEGGGHVHAYILCRPEAEGAEVVPPTCHTDGEYYYVCSCGAIGTVTFLAGEDTALDNAILLYRTYYEYVKVTE